jgi:hypothetical protein
VVVSEETGDVAIAHMGRIIHEVKPGNLENALQPLLLEEERLAQTTDLMDLVRSWLGIEKKEGK